MRFLLARNNRVSQKNYMRTGVRKLLRMGLVLARVWVGGDKQLALKLTRQMAAGAEDLSTMATLFLAEGVWMHKW